MKKFLSTVIVVAFATAAFSQKVIPLYSSKPKGSENWTQTEKEFNSPMIKKRVVYDVSEPTLTVYAPPPATANGTAVIVCPGGGFGFLSIDSEGIDVAKWLNTKGVTAFVLKYRVAKTLGSDPVRELIQKFNDPQKMESEISPVIPLSITDGIEALRYVRAHAAELKVNPRRVGIIGFSAGGTVEVGATLQYTPDSRPDFSAAIYPYMGYFKQVTVPSDAPPLFIATASDDNDLAPQSIDLYSKWLVAKKPVEIHMYQQGGHGFGMDKHFIPTDQWIDRFGEWLQLQGLLKPSDPNHWMNKMTPQQIAEMSRQQEDRVKNDWAWLKRYQSENEKLGPPNASENRVVFMGNSITEGWKRMDSSFFKGKPYVNRGISGQTTPQMLIRFRQDVLDLKPKVVVILAGINDIAQNTGPTTLEAIMGNIASMATLAKANNIKVILCSVLPAYDFPWRPGLEPAEKVVQLNKMIKDWADKNGAMYLDYFSAVVDERKGMKKEYASDEVHPTLAGYRVMEPLVEAAIAKALR